MAHPEGVPIAEKVALDECTQPAARSRHPELEVDARFTGAERRSATLIGRRRSLDWDGIDLELEGVPDGIEVLDDVDLGVPAEGYRDIGSRDAEEPRG